MDSKLKEERFIYVVVLNVACAEVLCDMTILRILYTTKTCVIIRKKETTLVGTGKMVWLLCIAEGYIQLSNTPFLTKSKQLITAVFGNIAILCRQEGAKPYM